MNYVEFLKDLDAKLEKYFNEQKDYVQCKPECSFCCEKGDYPLSQVELEYMMQGYIMLENEVKKIVQKNISMMEKGEVCPFLIDKKCSIYPYRPIICRTHGLAYICKENSVKVPYCAKYGKNYNSVYKNDELYCEPIKENLDSSQIFPYGGEIRNLYDWIRN